MIQSEFKPLVEEAISCCRAQFEERLLAVYLHGSIDKGDAVAGISDLDLFVVVSKVNPDIDQVWVKELSDMLREKHAVIDEAHIALMDESELLNDHFSRFALAYNATLLDGTDIAAVHNEQDAAQYVPDKRIAKMRLRFARRCFAEAQEGKQPACTGALPKDSRYAARKLARYFIVIEGAYFLMMRGVFQSFDKQTVLSQLRREAGEYEEIIDLAQGILMDPIAVGMTSEQLIEKMSPFVLWMFEQIENA